MKFLVRSGLFADFRDVWHPNRSVRITKRFPSVFMMFWIDSDRSGLRRGLWRSPDHRKSSKSPMTACIGISMGNHGFSDSVAHWIFYACTRWPQNRLQTLVSRAYNLFLASLLTELFARVCGWITITKSIGEARKKVKFPSWAPVHVVTHYKE